MSKVVIELEDDEYVYIRKEQGSIDKTEADKIIAMDDFLKGFVSKMGPMKYGKLHPEAIALTMGKKTYQYIACPLDFENCDALIKIESYTHDRWHADSENVVELEATIVDDCYDPRKQYGVGSIGEDDTMYFGESWMTLFSDIDRDPTSREKVYQEVYKQIDRIQSRAEEDERDELDIKGENDFNAI